MSSMLNVSLDQQSGVAVLKMKRPPVNSLNLEFLQEIRQSLVKLEQDKQCKGIVLASDVPKIFSAGLDILEMFQPKEDRLRDFWSTLQNTWLQLYLSPLPTVAAINGHSPAGGCLLAMSCDYRIMAPNYTIGLNETLLGIVAPFWFQDLMVNTIGHRETELALSLGRLFSTDEALQKGLIDQTVPGDDIMASAQSQLTQFIKIPKLARVATKLQCRQKYADRLRNTLDSDIQNFVQFIFQDKVQNALAFYLEQLKKKKSK